LAGLPLLGHSFGSLGPDSLKWIPVQAPVTRSTYENEPAYLFQMIPSETDRLSAVSN